MITFGKLGRYGRLGNQMFQVASTIGIARKRGYEFGFHKWENYDAVERFGSTEDNMIGNWFPKWKLIPLVEQDALYEYFIPWGYHGFDIPDGVSLVGHMQSDKYFKHCKDEIRELFTLKNETKLDATAIHIRLGDYGGDYHPICDAKYYEKAIRLIEGPYIVYSEDPKKAYDILSSVVPRGTHFHSGTTYDAFQSMKGCKNHIIANSTFSWWAAWLAGGEVVMPVKWFGPAAAQLDTKDLKPDTWTAL
jgi:hypothetical protein